MKQLKEIRQKLSDLRNSLSTCSSELRGQVEIEIKKQEILEEWLVEALDLDED